VIDEVTRTIVDLLATAADELDVSGIEVLPLSVPATTAGTLQVRLEAIEELAPLRNQRPAPGGGARRQLTGLRLRYLVTSAGETHLEVQRHLAGVLEVFEGTPVVTGAALRPALRARTEQVTIRRRSPSVEERYQVWAAAGRHAELALFYEVDVVLDPPTTVGQARSRTGSS
jgi:hypothetical protein